MLEINQKFYWNDWISETFVRSYETQFIRIVWANPNFNDLEDFQFPELIWTSNK